jgi:hypothetical protein
MKGERDGNDRKYGKEEEETGFDMGEKGKVAMREGWVDQKVCDRSMSK